MSNRFSRGHRDANEPKIVAVIQQYGYPYNLLPEGFGADILVLLSPMVFVEVKNPDQPPSARKLTKREQEVKDYCDAHRIPYHVIETPEAMTCVLTEGAVYVNIEPMEAE